MEQIIIDSWQKLPLNETFNHIFEPAIFNIQHYLAYKFLAKTCVIAILQGDKQR